MSRRTGYECDRCGKTVEPWHSEETIIPAAGWRRIKVIDGKYLPEWDLCDVCGPALSVWVEDHKRQQEKLAAEAPYYPPGVR